MFFKPKVSVSYNVRLKRARAQFQVAECLKSRHPPAEALDKARDKLEEELEDGHIEYFEVFEKRFLDLWQHIRKHKDTLAPDKLVRFTLAQGARAYSEIQLIQSKDPKVLAELNCQFSERRAKSVFFNAFVFHIMRQLKVMGLSERPDGAQLRFVYLLMKSGQPIVKWPLKAQPKTADYPNRKMLVEVDQQHRFATLHLLDARLLQDESKCESLFAKALVHLQDENSTDIAFTLLKDHTVQKLQSLTHKVQSLGFGLPYSLLIAVDAEYRLDAGVMHAEKQQAAQGDVAELPRWKMRLGTLMNRQKGEFIDIEVDSAHMQAKIRAVHQKQLDAIRHTITIDWLMHECHKQGVIFGYDDLLPAVLEVLQKNGNPIGMSIAKGQAAEPGHQVYLHEAWQQHAETKQESVAAMRERQNTRLARRGDLIAEVRFKDGIPGFTVYGEELHAVGAAQNALIAAGAGVLLRDGGRFYATRDGLIDRQGETLAVVDTYVHEGNVNLSSGNLAFEGAVLVRGDIEAGATVEVKGTLVVEGTIGNSIVKVQGNLDVKGGILTSQHGFVSVAGDCKAQFVENSRLHVKGRIEIQSSLLNSEVVCGKSLVVKDSSKGLLSGGQISCWEGISVQQLGLPQGQLTTCRIGTHYAGELRWSRLGRRLQAVAEAKDALAHLIKETPSPSGRKAVEAEANLKALNSRLQKAERLLQHIKQSLAACEKQLNWNNNATLAIKGILDRNAEIFAAGKKIKIAQALKGVLISAMPYRGSQINDLDVLEEFQKTWPDAKLADAS